ncbi:OmpL47-type beta-barrel domain-containing protein [Fictibacillus aquaticus]|uniref:Uncharacterized protein n=1 Tax=Fictibacillus aquaticus TaxID=2021314 RepID=A0A235F8A9_9BACL|nr:hypothetical protein [Fictibacillus aquaticus]OYD57540.1 hypothetical protein CGZ90_12785 [Fictibacillus aquaticus]
MKLVKMIAAGLLSTMLAVPAAYADEGQPTSFRGNLSPSEVQAPARSFSIMADGITGNIMQHDIPTQEYVNETSVISLANLYNYQQVNAVSDNNLTVTFDRNVEKLPIGVTWGTLPNVETIYPNVLFTWNNSLEMNLSKPAKTFGFELAPNIFNTPYPFTADFYNGDIIVGSITRTISSPYGVSLMAATATSSSFTKVRITTTGNPSGLAIAQIRYNLDNTAPETYATMAMVKNRFNVKLSASDDMSGVAKTEYRIDNGNWMTYEGGFSIGNKQTLEYRSVDNTGNVESTHFIGPNEEGYHLENVYVKTSKGIEGPYTRTITDGEEFLRLFMGLGMPATQ